MRHIQRITGPEYLGDIHHDNSGDGFDGIILLEFLEFHFSEDFSEDWKDFSEDWSVICSDGSTHSKGTIKL